jgi:hypothetical protein
MKYYVLAGLPKRFSNYNLHSSTKSIQTLRNLYQTVLVNNFVVPQRKWSDLSNDANKPVLRLLTKANCTLCEDSKHKIFSAPGLYEKRLVLKEVNILKQGNEELFDLYRYEIPVFFLGKIFISKNKIDLDKLEQELQKLEINAS